MRAKHESYHLHPHGKRMRFLRKQLGLSQTRFAIALNVHRNTIGRYEREICKVPDQIIERIEEIYAPDFSRIRAKRKLAKIEAVRNCRTAHQWERQQSKRTASKQAKQDRERYYAEFRGLRAVFNRWSIPVFVVAGLYFSAWFNVRNDVLPMLETTMYHDLSAVMAVLIVTLLAWPVVQQSTAFVRRQRLYYPQILTLPGARPPNFWIWKFSDRFIFPQPACRQTFQPETVVAIA